MQDSTQIDQENSGPASATRSKRARVGSMPSETTPDAEFKGVDVKVLADVKDKLMAIDTKALAATMVEEEESTEEKVESTQAEKAVESTEDVVESTQTEDVAENTQAEDVVESTQAEESTEDVVESTQAEESTEDVVESTQAE